MLVMASCMGTFDSPIPHWLLESKGYFSAAEEGELQSPLHFSPHPVYSMRSGSGIAGWGVEMP